MPDPEYQQLFEEDDLSFKFDNQKTERMVANKLKQIGPPVGSLVEFVADAPFPVFGVVLNVRSEYKTYKHIGKLKSIEKSIDENIKKSIDERKCTCGDCKNYINYILKKKRHKMWSKGVGIVPVVGTISTVGHKAKGLNKKRKGTRGKDRMNVATGLWFSMRGHSGGVQCVTANMIVRELCGGEKARKRIVETGDGYNEIFKKLASS
jgi:hypothetical protein